MLSAECTIDLHEGLEHRVEFFGLNTDPRIADAYNDADLLVELRCDVDASALVCKLYGVANEIQEYLLSLAFIGAEQRYAIRRIRLRTKASLL